MIHSTDLTITVIYIAAIFSVGVWVGMADRRKSRTGAASRYFLAGKSLRWPAIGLALFATNISTVHLVSLAQSGFDTGLLNGNFEWMAAFVLILLALFFVPFYLKSGVATLPDFLEKRYDRFCRDWLVMVSIVSAMVIHIGFSMLAGGIVLQTLFGVSMYSSVALIAFITAIYTIIGGLKAVVVTESIQTLVLIAGAGVISIAAYHRLGGWDPLVGVLRQHGQMEKLSMLRPAGDSSGMPWYAVFLGYPVLGIWYWCADQTIVQRVLGAKDVNHARAGALFCGFIKILPVFIFVLPGLLAYALAETGKLDISALRPIGGGEKGIVNSKGIYTLMITQLLPTGLVGVLVAALLSGIMSQVSGALNSISTLVGYDIYKRYRPGASDRQLVRIGKISAGAALIVSVAMLPLLNSYESIFNGLNEIIAHVAPPITCVFLLGIFWKRASAIAARWTLWVGSALGIVIFTIGKLSKGSVISHVPFMMIAFYLFCACALFQVILSFIYPMVHTERSKELYWKSFLEPLEDKGWRGWKIYKTLSLMLLLVMAVLFGIFR